MPTDYETLAKKYGGRRTSSGPVDYAALAKKYGGAVVSTPDTRLPDFTMNLKREGTYAMLDKSGKSFQIPYSSVGKAAQSGYTMHPDDRDKFMRDAAADKKVARFFPDLRKLPEGVKIVGMNPAGQPVFGPVGTAPKGSAAERLLSNFGEQLAAPVAGMYHAFADAPRNPEEARVAAKDGMDTVRFNRLIVDPEVSEFRKAKEEFRQVGPLKWNDPEQNAHLALAAGHTLGMIPFIGAGTAAISEKSGQQAGSGDWAGAAGTLGGAAAVEAAPKLGAKVLRSEYLTKTLPKKAINRIIRPMAKDVQFDQDPAAAILEEGIIAKDIDPGAGLESIKKQVAAKAEKVGKDIDQVVKNPKYANTKVDLNHVYKPLNDAIDAAEKAGDKKLYRRLWEVRSELRSEWQGVPGSAKPLLKRRGQRSMTMSPAEALQFKRMVSKRIRWSQDALDEPVNEALGAVYGQVRDSLNQAVPELTDLNRSYANLTAAAKAIERRLPVERRQAWVSLMDVALGLGSIKLAIARKIATHPFTESLVAQGAYRLPAVIPKHVPLGVTVPAIGAMQAQQNRPRTKTLRELRQEAARRRPAPVAAAQ